MKTWLEFEHNCTEYLNRTFGTDRIQFIDTGGSDSTQSDIQCHKDRKTEFYIEAKMPVAQCGQFVLLQGGQEFTFSRRNKSHFTETTKKIIEIMNKNFEIYKKGAMLEISDELSYAWVEEHYSEHNVKFFITEGSSGFMIFPLEAFRQYFNIRAVYRIKKSGSASLSQNQLAKVKKIIHQHDVEAELWSENNRIYVRTMTLRPKMRIDTENLVYYLSPTENPTICEVRKLSKTNHMNVIFTIELKNDMKQNPNDLAQFKRELMN